MSAAASSSSSSSSSDASSRETLEIDDNAEFPEVYTKAEIAAALTMLHESPLPDTESDASSSASSTVAYEPLNTKDSKALDAQNASRPMSVDQPHIVIIGGAKHKVLWHDTSYNYKRLSADRKKSNPDVRSIMSVIESYISSAKPDEHTSFQLIENLIGSNKENTGLTIHRLVSDHIEGSTKIELFSWDKFEQTNELNDLSLPHLNPTKGAHDAIASVNGAACFNKPIIHNKPGITLKTGSKTLVDNDVRAALRGNVHRFDIGSTDGVILPIVLCFVVLRDMYVAHTDNKTRLNRPNPNAIGDPSVDIPPHNECDLLDSSIGPNRIIGFGPLGFSSSAIIVLSCFENDEPVAPFKESEFEFFYDNYGCFLDDRSADMKDINRRGHYAELNRATGRRMHAYLLAKSQKHVMPNMRLFKPIVHEEMTPEQQASVLATVAMLAYHRRK